MAVLRTLLLVFGSVLLLAFLAVCAFLPLGSGSIEGFLAVSRGRNAAHENRHLAQKQAWKQRWQKPAQLPQEMLEPMTYYPHFDTTPDYLNISAMVRGVNGNDGTLSDNYYIVIGDWGGCSSGDPGMCARQKAVAALADQYVQLRKQQNPRSTLLFVLSVGDNFYWMGANSDTMRAGWANVYSQDLLSVPWFSVMGNHDYGNNDPGSVCPSRSPRFSCASGDTSPACGGQRPYSTEPQSYNSNQLDAGKGGAGGAMRENYHMPDYTYYYSIPALDFELLALDQTSDWLGGLGGNGLCANCGGSDIFAHCDYSMGALQSSLVSVKEASLKILRERAAAAEHNNVAILSHYPGNGFRNLFLNITEQANNMTVLNFFGHDHSQSCLESDERGNCVEFLTGGGGGCCTDADHPAGFSVVSWDDSSGLQFPECFGEDSLKGIPCTMLAFRH